MHSHSLLVVRLALAIALALATPLAARAQLAVTTGGFGHHLGGSTLSDNLVQMPIGRSECDEVIPFELSGLGLATTTRFVDVWRSSSVTTTCGDASARLPPDSVCRPVVLEPGVNERFAATSSFTMGVTPRELFGGCVSDSATFWLLDAAVSPDETTQFLPGSYTFIQIALDVDAPSAPTIPSSPYGDDEIDLTWANPPDLPDATGMFVYFDPAGCGTDDAGVAHPSSPLLVPGAPAPHDLLATEDFFPHSHTMVGLDARVFGWSPAHYGEQGALAITVLDSAYNESVLSNVVCVAHLPTTTVEAGAMPDAGVGDGRYLIRACSIGGRPQPVAAAPMGLALLVIAVRRRRPVRSLR